MPLSAAWRQAWRAAPWVLAAVVTVLVARQAVRLDWAAVGSALAAMPGPVLATAAALALAGHAAFAGFDVVGRLATRHAASASRAALIGATGYAMNLNLGALIGGVAIRLDLYRRSGVGPAQAARVVGAGMVANWCGWALLVAAVAWLAQPLPWPPAWPQPAEGVRLGLTLAGAVPAALLLAGCAWRRRWPVAWPLLRRELPPVSLAAAWLVLAVASWVLAATTLWWLLQGAVPWPAVAGALLLAAVAGVVTHVPGGLGVLEAVVLATLAGQATESRLLAALLAYRAVYYGIPLVVAVGSYGWLVSRPSRGEAGDSSGPVEARLREVS